MTESSKPSFPNKAIRDACNAARDSYFDCLDQNNNNETSCATLKKMFEQDCPSIWVTIGSMLTVILFYTKISSQVPHFLRRRKYLQFKDKMEKGELDPVEFYDQQSRKVSI